MPFLVTCTHCGKTLNAPDNALGKRLRCPTCGQAFQAPEVPLADVVEVAPPPPVREADEKGITALPAARPAPRSAPAAPRRARDDDEDDDRPRRDRPRRRAEPVLWPWLVGGGAGLLVLVVLLVVVVWAWNGPADTKVAALPDQKAPVGDKKVGLPDAPAGAEIDKEKAKEKEEPPPTPAEEKEKKQEEPPPAPGEVAGKLPKQDLPHSTKPGQALDARPLSLAGGTVTAMTLNLGGQKLVGDLCWSQDGKSFFVLDENGVLRRVALDGFREEKRLDLNRRCGWLAVSKRGLVATLLDLQEVWVIDPNTLHVTKRVAAPAAERVVSSPALDVAIAANSRNGLTVLDLVKGAPVREYQNLPGRHATVTPDGKYLFAQGGIEQLQRILIDRDNLLEEQSSDRIAQNGQRINVSPDGKYVCLPSGGGNPRIPGAPETKPYSTYIFPVDNLKRPALTINSGAYPRVVGFDPKAGTIFAQNGGTPLLVYSYTGIKQKEVNTSGRDRLDPVQFLAHPDGGKLLIRTDKEVVFVDLTGATPPPAKGPAADPPSKGGAAAVRPLFFDTGGFVNSVVLSPDGRVLVTAAGNQVRRWDAGTGRALGAPWEHPADVHAVDYSPDGEYIASACTDGHARLWHTKRDARTTFPKQPGSVGRVRFSPKGDVLAVHSDQAFKLWDVRSGNERAALKGVKGTAPFGLTNVAFSRDGKRIAAGDGPSEVRVWDAATGALRKTLAGHLRQVVTVDFSPDGKLLASAGLDNTVKLWDATTFEELASLKGHSEMVLTVTFSPDSRLLASASQDGWLKLWDVKTRQEVAALPENNVGQRYSVRTAVFSRDGSTLASGWNDKTARLWDVRKVLEKAPR